MYAVYDALVLLFLIFMSIADSRTLRVPPLSQTSLLLLCSLRSLILFPHDALLHALSGFAIAAILLVFRRYAGSPGMADITALFSLAVGYGGLPTLAILTIALFLAIVSVITQSLLLRSTNPCHNAVPLLPVLTLAFVLFLLAVHPAHVTPDDLYRSSVLSCTRHGP